MDNAEFKTSEQYMMAMKAQLMRDLETAEKIMASTTPAEAKTLGRQVKNFNQAVSLPIFKVLRPRLRLHLRFGMRDVTRSLKGATGSSSAKTSD